MRELPSLSPRRAGDSKFNLGRVGISSPAMSTSRPPPLPPTLTIPISSLIRPDSPFYEIQNLSGHLHPLHIVHLSNGSRLVVKRSPPPWIPLLRHEGAQLSTEAAALAILAKSSLPIPRLVQYESRSLQAGPSFLVTMYLPGTSYADIRPQMTGSERGGIERQIRSLSDVITQYTSPTFGPVDAVAGGRGFRTWEAAFTAMMESILMDGDDMLVALPFGEIRHLVKQMGPLCRKVQPARLVVRGLGEEQNVLIDGRNHEVVGLLDWSGAFWGDEEWFKRDGERGIL